jgi:hypothetical protein
MKFLKNLAVSTALLALLQPCTTHADPRLFTVVNTARSDVFPELNDGVCVTLGAESPEHIAWSEVWDNGTWVRLEQLRAICRPEGLTYVIRPHGKTRRWSRICVESTNIDGQQESIFTYGAPRLDEIGKAEVLYFAGSQELAIHLRIDDYKNLPIFTHSGVPAQADYLAHHLIPEIDALRDEVRYPVTRRGVEIRGKSALITRVHQLTALPREVGMHACIRLRSDRQFTMPQGAMPLGEPKVKVVYGMTYGEFIHHPDTRTPLVDHDTASSSGEQAVQPAEDDSTLHRCAERGERHCLILSPTHMPPLDHNNRRLVFIALDESSCPHTATLQCKRYDGAWYDIERLPLQPGRRSYLLYGHHDRWDRRFRICVLAPWRTDESGVPWQEAVFAHSHPRSSTRADFYTILHFPKSNQVAVVLQHEAEDHRIVRITPEPRPVAEYLIDMLRAECGQLRNGWNPLLIRKLYSVESPLQPRLISVWNLPSDQRSWVRVAGIPCTEENKRLLIMRYMETEQVQDIPNCSAEEWLEQQPERYSQLNSLQLL